MGISSLSNIPHVSPQTRESPSYTPTGFPSSPPTGPDGAPNRVPRSKTQRAQPLSQEQHKQAVVEKLKARDREVRAHELAHLSRAGGLAKGGAKFAFQKGPDGRMYAVAGSVQLDTSPVPGNPEATIRKAQQIRAAALAPANPSGQDRAVADIAVQMEAQARLELQRRTRQDQPPEGQGPSSSKDSSASFKSIDLYA